MLLNFLPCFAADDDGGSGGSGEIEGKIKPSDVLQRYGQTAESALRMAEKLAESENANWRLREKNRTLSDDLKAVQSKVPADDARILTTDEAAAYDAYTALGLKPADIQKAIEDSAATKGELTSLKRADAFRAAAEAHGYKPAALAKLPSLANQDIAIEDVETKGSDGKPVKAKRAYVTVDGKKTALPDYIEAHDAEFLPALALAAEPAASRGDGVGSPAGGGKRPAGAPEMRSPGITI
jgi:hypothetical protein